MAKLSSEGVLTGLPQSFLYKRLRRSRFPWESYVCSD